MDDEQSYFPFVKKQPPFRKTDYQFLNKSRSHKTLKTALSTPRATSGQQFFLQTKSQFHKNPLSSDITTPPLIQSEEDEEEAMLNSCEDPDSLV